MKRFYVLSILLILFSYSIMASEYKAITIKRDTIDLVNEYKEKYLVIICYGYGYTCFDCFKYLVKSLDSLKQKNNALEYIFLARVDNSSQSRRAAIQTLQSIKKDGKVFFDIYEDKNKEHSLFEKQQIIKTPAILTLHNGKSKYLPYNYFNFVKNDTYNKIKRVIEKE